ncbi:hypothetical protein [Mycobacterium palustre]|uniref:Uncharacterized protein n=1 Tax=Mycobacterium palustre TaxID=153971 RepID=A0A1X1ZKH7_9MYCO|nr:hypothetical protein [Mycobacterium palustre]ORW23621.1 hypothetical protein AWC19_11135 [Mycobacterium palustre]
MLGHEVGKAGFLLAIDGMRAGARAAGPALPVEGVLDNTEDVFFLTLDEILTDPRVDRGDVIGERRTYYTRYKTLDLPLTWQGNPIPVPLDAATSLPNASISSRAWVSAPESPKARCGSSAMPTATRPMISNPATSWCAASPTRRGLRCCQSPRPS